MGNKLSIITHPNSALREMAREILASSIISPDVQNLIAAMLVTMYGDDGIGLAAPQVGRSVRIICVGKQALSMTKNPEDFAHGQDLVLINPQITKKSLRKEWGMEGCLSVPGVFGEVKRYVTVGVTALSPTGAALAFDASDFLARVIQHEIDHLDGALFIDKARDLVRAKRTSRTEL
ncbi:MAG: peptide deformylase [Candidatus Magasanikbacteria bacterium]|nr:peptide deformylase [Candidatus Magasanikbacteria bacterium]